MSQLAAFRRVVQQFSGATALLEGPGLVVTSASPAYLHLAGGRGLLGRPVGEVVPELAERGFVTCMARAYQTGEVCRGTGVPVRLRDGEEALLEFVCTPLRDDGPIVALVLWMDDMTERARAAEAERVAREHVQLLADAGTVLAGSLDLHDTLDRLARVVVPAIADWCFVETPTPGGRIEPLVIHHADPELVALAHDMLARYPLDPEAPYGTGKVLRSGEAEVVSQIPEWAVDAVAQGPEHAATIRRLGFVSHISLPLTARGTTLGVLSLVTSGSGRTLSEDDLPFTLELARKAAVAIDNARLFAAEQEARRSAEREAERSRRLRDLAAELNRAATPEQVAAACVVHGMEALQAAAGSLALLSEDASGFEIVRSDGYPPEVSERWKRFPLRAGRPLSDAVLTRTPVLLGTRGAWAAAYPDAASDPVDGDLLAFAAVPVALGSRAIGGLSFSFAHERPFDESDRTFLAMLGEQAAQALERARLLETERHAREAAEEANRAKTEFLSAMSHELRTPLNAISGYVDLMEMGIHGPVTDDQAASLRRIKRAQEVLLSLINDVLNYARVEAGRLEIERGPVSVAESLAALEPLIAPQVSARGLAYECEPCDSSLRVTGDAERIRQILLNLLTNAVKFTSPGGRISVSAHEGDGMVAVRVSDTGRGIPADKLESIFDPFVQVDRHRTDASQQGVGLGLAISRELARAMGGDLLAESVPGQGSTFSLTLEAAAAEESLLVNAAPAGA